MVKKLALTLLACGALLIGIGCGPNSNVSEGGMNEHEQKVQKATEEVIGGEIPEDEMRD